MLSQLVKGQWILVQSRDPLLVQASPNAPVSGQPPGIYEKMLIDAAQDDGRFSESELEDLLNAIVKNVQQKAWDCDVDATKILFRPDRSCIYG
jgi:hypothetical protein